MSPTPRPTTTGAAQEGREGGLLAAQEQQAGRHLGSTVWPLLQEDRGEVPAWPPSPAAATVSCHTCWSCLMLLWLPIFSSWALKAWMLAAPSENRRTGEKRSVGRCRVLESL